MPSAKMENYVNELRKFLHQKNMLCDALGYVEKKTHIDRAYIFLAASGAFAAYMIFGYFAELLCNAIGFVYPAYASVLAIESTRKDDDVQWLTYWIVFGLLRVAEVFVDVVFGWMPLYWLVKVCLIVYLFLPSTRGAEVVYRRWVRPAYYKYFPAVDNAARGMRGAF